MFTRNTIPAAMDSPSTLKRRVLHACQPALHGRWVARPSGLCIFLVTVDGWHCRDKQACRRREKGVTNRWIAIPFTNPVGNRVFDCRVSLVGNTLSPCDGQRRRLLESWQRWLIFRRAAGWRLGVPPEEEDALITILPLELKLK
ncbi:hypothetical protein MANES_04G055144v8 [Manihot esculenta]|uniref:Uncharacterized protein n=1 Tax=Manihot esculenta TaxID=3983 RepID=A0ACB7HSY9_MANES|nr:hypothetical protein MANES_04G055144v8 [Manihot esculenta]